MSVWYDIFGKDCASIFTPCIDFEECTQICGVKKQSLQSRVEDFIHLEDHRVFIFVFVRKSEERRNTKVFCR
jgi:hypothetical protein